MSNASESQSESKCAKPAYLVIQEGGTSSELYVHASDSVVAAEDFREDCCKHGGYRTSSVIEVPAVLAAHGEDLYELIEEVLRAERDFPST